MIGSNRVCPGARNVTERSVPLRYWTTSVVRRSADTLEIPATIRPSQRTRNLKFLYGSCRFALTENCAT